jgi:preprotein translocase subunit SecG
MFTFLIVLILIIASLLIMAVLVQNSKKEGLNNPFGDASASQLIGVKKTSDLLEQITWGLVIALFVLTLASSFFLNKQNKSGTLPLSPNINRAQERGVLPDVTEQDTPASPPAVTSEEGALQSK